jgi:hypothetical protein
MAPSFGPSDSTLSPPSHQALVVRSLLSTTAKDREQILEDVEYNIFAFPAGLVTCDYLSDSGTSAMTDIQWAACKIPQIQPHLILPGPSLLSGTKRQDEV